MLPVEGQASGTELQTGRVTRSTTAMGVPPDGHQIEGQAGMDDVSVTNVDAAQLRASLGDDGPDPWGELRIAVACATWWQSSRAEVLARRS